MLPVFQMKAKNKAATSADTAVTGNARLKGLPLKTRRPAGIFIFSIIYMVLPLVNYVLICLEANLPILEPVYFLRNTDPLYIALVLLPFLMGLNILLINRFSLFLFVGFNFFLVGYNLFLFVSEASRYNISAVLQSFLGSMAIIFFTSRDISMPYIKKNYRGWRRKLRRKAVVFIQFQNARRKTRDISELGAYVIYQKAPFEDGTQTQIQFKVADQPYDIAAEIIRNDGRGLALRFIGLSMLERKKLRRNLQQQEIIQYEKNMKFIGKTS